MKGMLLLFVCSCLLNSADGMFVLNSTSFNQSLLLSGFAHVVNGSLSLIPEASVTSESPIDPSQKAGVAYYEKPVKLLDHGSKSTASFSTSFKFREIPQSYNSPNNFLGDGMTFAIAPWKNWIGGTGRRLGLYPTGRTQSKLVAIEYDNFPNGEYNDPNYTHIGVNLDRNGTSRKVGTSSILQRNIWTGDPMWSWIDYNGSSKELEVRLSNSSTRPDSAVLNYNIDLLGHLDEEMWVGFSGASGDSYSYIYIDWWEFNSFGLPQKKGRKIEGLIVGCAVGGGFAIAVTGFSVFLLLLRKKRREEAEYRAEDELRQMPGMPDHFSYKQLSAATRAFSESSKLGEGGFGSVYKGTLVSSGTMVAVKRVKADSKQGMREFLAEVSIISQLRHRNVVQLMGYCRERGKLLLVYELLPNGSLDKALFHATSAEHVIDWSQRMKILYGLASALHYLHQGWRQQVIHRDVKSSNIMLDDEFNAKLGDFGLARLVDHSKNATTTLVAGTYGYIAPEASVTGKFTDKTDVYAFGAVALELATGRRAFDGTAAEDDEHLVDMVWKRLSDGQLISVVDRRLEGKFDVVELEIVLMMGLLCSHPDHRSRPSMRQVVQVLAGDAPVPPIPASKPSPVFSTIGRAITLKDLQGSTSSTMELEPNTGSSSWTNNSSSLSRSSASFTRLRP
ncbi:protein MpRLK-Pelle_L-LEC9 [Marchantia polymorpha subsp. ruderalis]|uniref:Protein kinase domain-containing protein n=2 Tax=Marchantia polymorpha TaxID=3197 RepID=A0AAF6BC99_MARPO|nr:hypothetical protein MARPO_0090s0086 [Marchantia polymorpha]BAF79939.1 receptor-like kinase [Marchantia polymorpha]BBN09633.1 hypothetical protein Mp_4g21350 [Marchantia polymorpha subsp. ruderalis]|eukprot:PTQ33353.1 hypothetical protein MARPO_0090s0086 [Marchantia polymorpha]